MMEPRVTQSIGHHEPELGRVRPIDELNELPAALLNVLQSKQGFLVCRPNTKKPNITGCSTSTPADLKELVGFDAIEELRQRFGVHSILAFVLQVTPDLIQSLELLVPEFPTISSELQELTATHKDVFVVYVVTHSNPDYGPCGQLSVGIGGDCYRDDQVDFKSVIERTSLLARAMARKSAMLVPSIPALLGGKKGEWIVLDSNGLAIQGISEGAKIALGAVVIKQGIEFLNSLKLQDLSLELRKASRGSHLMPDSASPDTLSGKYWALLNRIWQEIGLDPLFITCRPLSEPLTEPNSNPMNESSASAVPTGYGVATTAVRLSSLTGKELEACNFLIEALGGVSFYTIDSLINRYGIDPARITAFDPSEIACERARKAFPGVTITCQTDVGFYSADTSAHFDIWINNGLGNRTTPAQVEWLLNHGVLLFCGGANNFLRKRDEHLSLTAIWNRGAWAWPDEATSGGGWLYATMDLYVRTLGQNIQRDELLRRSVARVERSNITFIESIFVANTIQNGRELWEQIRAEVDRRVAQSTSGALPVSEIAAAVDINRWNL